MTTLAIHSETRRELIKPEPRLPISIRAATERDLKFIDALQKKHGKAVAFASTKELLSYINETKTALIAETKVEKSTSQNVETVGAASFDVSPFDVSTLAQPVGYCLYRDRYMKREDCGYVSQLVVDSSKHRGLVGAALVQAMFERLPYGVRLFCLWCAQDLEANRFWEALGFVPLAYRAGSRGKEHGGRRSGGTRVQIFWERRVRDGDECAYWYPSQTFGGRMGEARIVLPIPPGKHWSDELLLVLPGIGSIDTTRQIDSDAGAATVPKPRQRKPKVKGPAAPRWLPLSVTNGLRFGAAAQPASVETKAEKPAKPKREKHKNDPKHVAAARELRDRYLEQVNKGLVLPPANGKYDVSRQLEAASSTLKQTPLLKAA